MILRRASRKADKYQLTDEQRRLYAAEKLDNFRWIAKTLATRSTHVLTDVDLADPTLTAELAEIGEFEEVVYSSDLFDVGFIYEHLDELSQPGFPLDGHHALFGSRHVSSIKGATAQLPAYLAYRPTQKQLVLAIAGTMSFAQALYDLKAWMCRHPSGRGRVHSGFWDLYTGIRSSLLDAMRDGVAAHEVEEIVIVGHSMGGAMAYFLCADMLSDETHVQPAIRTRLVVFGAPRSGDENFVNYWRELVSSHRSKHGFDSIREYSVKAYNDGVPALPPTAFGYRHCAAEPFYLHMSQLYKVPPSESEHSVFKVSTSNAKAPQFPRGGHNYYNDRDLEKFRRRIEWLDKASADKPGWEERYKRFALQVG